ncbi:hypothetical protein NP493_94g04032 [Ridgeia piscesae]|uniref:Fanconi Anaemia group E protein C-terminal domain-containing protein n=1 Tax=Ridgeia piscesae TaxID=27915 RepID=A0AAD9UHU6_RIDPI|nr:hypothetical protein NP493_94g04032 [Ridgeia piscesae]
MTLLAVVSHLPHAWQGLLKALFVRDWPLAAAETWLRQNQDSAYGDTLSWTALIEALCREEPVSCKGPLKFKPRLFHLPPSLQQHLVATIHQHHQDICVDTLQRFVTVLQSDDDAMSNGWLKTYIGWLNWNCQRRCDTKRSSSGSRTYSFSAENESHFKALCNKLSRVERSRGKRIWQSVSPLPCSLPVVDDIETPTKVKSPTQSSHSDNVSCLSMDGDGARKKRKLQKDTTSGEHNHIEAEDTGSRDTENVLDSDVQVQLAKLKELWEAGKEEPLPRKELSIFTQSQAQTVVEVCQVLATAGLTEVAVVTACKHFCGVSDDISHEKALVIASTLLLPKVTNQHVDLVSNVLKTLNPAQQKEFLRKFLSESWSWNESTTSLLLNILDLKIDMDNEELSKLVSSVKRSGIQQIKELKFAKVLLEMINKYGKQMTVAHFGQLTEILQQNESFLKKSGLAAIAKLQNQQS